MWKYISGVSKVVDEKEKENAPKAACDTKDYEKTRTRKFSTKWQVGQPWLKYSMMKRRYDLQYIDERLGWKVNFWASAFWGSLAQMASALKLKFPTPVYM